MGQSKIRSLWGFMKGERIKFLLTTLCIMFNVVFNYTGPLIIAWTVDAIIRRQTMDIPAAVLEIIGRLGGAGYLAANLWICGLGLLLVAILRSLTAFFQGYLTGIVSEGTVKRIKEALYDHIQRLPYQYHVGAESGDLVQRCTTDVETVRHFLAGKLMELFSCVFILLFADFVLGRVNLILTLLSLMLMPVSFVYSYFFSKMIQKQFKLADEADGAMSTVLQENLTGVRVVRAFGREKFEQRKFSRSIEKLRGRLNKLATLNSQFWSFSDFTAMTQQAITLFGAMYYTINGTISYGMFLVFNSYIGMLVWPLRQLGRVLTDASKMLISMGRINEVLAEKQEDSGLNPVTPPIAGDIVFDHVSFTYGGREVLKNLSFTVKQGETVAILGETGSGKSTLVQLLQRLYDYQEGSITIGGAELRTIDKQYLRSRVGIVLQEPFLYSKTIFENIGVTQENPGQEEIEDVARIAALHEVIEGFEEQYETMVGERGVTLSGGQKQRIAIARSLLRENDILIFDDSLSAVDTETDR
ncbi:MAG: ABC transporter ATP-binding protein, partial [Clostridia bacterium]|nr:ABC transporter ATP-binding protein [Clostridia bacterium]